MLDMMYNLLNLDMLYLCIIHINLILIFLENMMYMLNHHYILNNMLGNSNNYFEISKIHSNNLNKCQLSHMLHNHLDMQYIDHHLLFPSNIHQHMLSNLLNLYKLHNLLHMYNISYSASNILKNILGKIHSNLSQSNQVIPDIDQNTRK